MNIFKLLFMFLYKQKPFHATCGTDTFVVFRKNIHSKSTAKPSAEKRFFRKNSVLWTGFQNFWKIQRINLLKILTYFKSCDIIIEWNSIINHGRGASRHQYSFRSRFPIAVEAQKGALAESVRTRVRVAWFGK